MGRIPRAFLNLDRVAAGNHRKAESFVWVPKTGTYWLQVEGNGIKTVHVDALLAMVAVRTYAESVPVALLAGWRKVVLDVEAIAEGSLRVGIALGGQRVPRYPEWVKGGGENTRFSARLVLPPTFREAASHFVVYDGAAELEVNGRTVMHLGDYMPYSHWGQQAADVTPWLRAGDNVLTLHWIDEADTVRALVDGMWTDAEGTCHGWDLSPWQDETGEPLVPVAAPTEDHWLVPRPHLLPDVGWLEPNAVQGELLTWTVDPARAGKPVWIRCILPVGAREVRVSVAGTTEAWIDGEVARMQQDRIELVSASAHRTLTIRIVPDGPLSEAAVLRAPIQVEISCAMGALGGWRETLGLSTYSGVVEYERVIEGQGQQAVLSLGDVRGPAEVWVDGWNAGVRLWHPYQFDVTPAWGPGPHRLKVRITNTLGAYYAEGKPTSLCPEPQSRNGLFGPVEIDEA